MTFVRNHQISTLLYCFNERDEVLLLERAQEPNLGLWSPCGGKLHTETGESPYACACREAEEEIGLRVKPTDLHLTGIIAEQGYQGQSHWLMFLFEVKPKLATLPPPHREGRFQFFSRAQLPSLKMPQTDIEQIWPLFWQHRGGFFAANCECHPETNLWMVEESRPLNDPNKTTPKPGRLLNVSESIPLIEKIISTFRPKEKPKTNIPIACLLEGEIIKPDLTNLPAPGSANVYAFFEPEQVYLTTMEEIIHYLRVREPWEDYDMCICDLDLSWCFGISHEDQYTFVKRT